MNKYLKYQSPWMQLLSFVSLTLIIFFTAVLIATKVIASVYDLSVEDFSTFDFSKPNMVDALKALQAVMSITLFLVPSLVFAYLSDPKPLSYAGFKPPVPGRFYIIGMVAIVAAFPMVAWLGELNQQLPFPKSLAGMERWIKETESNSQSMLKQLLEMRSLKDLFLMIVILAVVPAIAEECFFRGILQRLMIQITKRPWIGIIITSVLFSAFHGQFLGFFPRAVLGMILGALFWYSGSLWPGILAHFVNNALQIIWVYKYPDFAEKEPDFTAGLIAASSIAAILLTWYMYRISQTSFAEVYDTDDDFHIGPRDQYIA